MRSPVARGSSQAKLVGEISQISDGEDDERDPLSGDYRYEARGEHSKQGPGRERANAPGRHSATEVPQFPVSELDVEIVFEGGLKLAVYDYKCVCLELDQWDWACSATALRARVGWRHARERGGWEEMGSRDGGRTRGCRDGGTVGAGETAGEAKEH